MTVNEAVLVESPSTTESVAYDPIAIQVGRPLTQYQAIISSGGLAYLVMQGDGNLCSYTFGGSQIASTHTSGTAATFAILTSQAVLQLWDGHGNLVFSYPDDTQPDSTEYQVRVADTGTVSCYSGGLKLWTLPD